MSLIYSVYIFHCPVYMYVCCGGGYICLCKYSLGFILLSDASIFTWLIFLLWFFALSLSFSCLYAQPHLHQYSFFFHFSFIFFLWLSLLLFTPAINLSMYNFVPLPLHFFLYCLFHLVPISTMIRFASSTKLSLKYFPIIFSLSSIILPDKLSLSLFFYFFFLWISLSSLITFFL